jgi:glucose/arabinose dehydrogenase
MSPVRFVLLALLLTGCASAGGSAPAQLEDIQLPPGFVITVYADVPYARSMALGADGAVYVGTRGADKVYAVRDGDGDGRGETVTVIAEGLDTPNGVAYRDGALYVAEVSRVLRLDGVDDATAPLTPKVVRDDLPTDEQHGWKYLRFGPDGKLYVPIGAPCNVCDPGEPYASIMRMNADGSELETYAVGIRNTVGFDWHPDTGALWFTENGRDKLGDDVPGDELNRAPDPGMHFGYPFCHQGDVLDPEFGAGHSCADYTPPVQVLGAHVGALGMRFYDGAMFPAEYRGQVFIAEHGSWNREDPLGYRVMTVRLDGERATDYEVFAEGWLQGGDDDGDAVGSADAWGRPVDLLVMPDGALLVSDDTAGKLYRISYRDPA